MSVSEKLVDLPGTTHGTLGEDASTDSADEWFEDATRVQNAGDLNEALRKWQEFRARFPNDPRGYTGHGSALRNLSRLGDAESVLDEGLERFPTEENIVTIHAWVAHSRGDLPEANRRWNALRIAYPTRIDGYFGGGAILRAMSLYDEADELYRSAFARMPVSFGLCGDFAAVAQSRGDFAEASRRWIVLHTLFPNRLDAYLREARALRDSGLFAEADTVAAEALKRFPGSGATKIELAQIAQQRGRWAEALSRWEVVITDCPGQVDGYVGAAQALNEFGRFADAQSILQPAVRKFPDSSGAASLSAWTEHYRGNFVEASIRWTAFRERFPEQSTGVLGGVASYLAGGKREEAAQLLEASTRRFPNDVYIAMELARVPQYVERWDEAVRRWQSVVGRFPDNPVVKASYAFALSKSGESDKADEFLGLALLDHQHSFEIHAAFAGVASDRRDRIGAVERWRPVVEAFPARIDGWVGLGEALRKAGHIEESTTIFSAALERFPGHITLERNLAINATAVRNWPTALSMWVKLKGKHPHNRKVRDEISQAVLEAQQDLAAAHKESAPETAAFEIPAALLENHDAEHETGSLRSLFMRFESIGDTCEFGIVQRRFGAEPISLLRWSSTPPVHLVTALNTDFEGVGEAEHTIIRVSHGEYVTQDRRYHMFSHTFTPEGTEPLDRFTIRHLRRMKFLRKKLLEDLANGEKSFVYKTDAGISDEEAHALFEAIRRFGGQPVLLCVRLQDAANPSGSLRQLNDGLFLGYIDRFSTVDINVDTWAKLCQDTERLSQRGEHRNEPS